MQAAPASGSGGSQTPVVPQTSVLQRLYANESLSDDQRKEAETKLANLYGKIIGKMSLGTAYESSETELIKYMKKSSDGEEKERTHRFVYIRTDGWLGKFGTWIKQGFYKTFFGDRLQVLGKGNKVDLSAIQLDQPKGTGGSGSTADVPGGGGEGLSPIHHLFASKTLSQEESAKFIQPYLKAGAVADAVPTGEIQQLSGSNGLAVICAIFKNLLAEEQQFASKHYDFFEALLNKAVALAGKDDAPSINDFLNAIKTPRNEEKMKTFFERKETYEKDSSGQLTPVKEWVARQQTREQKWTIKES